MRVAIIAEVYLPKIDGVVNRTLNLIRRLKELGDDVLVVCPRAEGAESSEAAIVGVHSFPFPLYPEYRIGCPDRQLAEVIQKFKPDVLHYVNPFAFGFRCLDVFDRYGVETPTIFSFHTLYGEFAKRYGLLKPLSRMLWWMMREYHNCADTNITVSTITQADLRSRGFERVEFWPPAVDTALFHPDRKSAEMQVRLAPAVPNVNKTSSKFRLLTVSRLAAEKNVGFFADVLDRIPEASLAIVGDGPERPALEKRFAGKNARFLGYLKGEELATAYASSDLFVYASETETMGNVILEAMACGCGVIAPRAGGIPSLVTEGKTALLYRPGDLNDAVRCIRGLLADAPLRSQLGLAARESVEPMTWRNSAETVRRIYCETIGQCQRSDHLSIRKRRRAQALLAALVTTFRSLARTQSSRPQTTP